jgi:hypothetical protein
MGNFLSIQYNGYTYRGPAVDGNFGVFSHEGGAVFSGSHANGSARVGVYTGTSGYTEFVECDADGNFDGRYLGCHADGDSGYCLFEHGSIKERADLLADGTCEYNGMACRADFPPFVKLKAKVLPIKARPTAHSRPVPHSPPPTPSPSTQNRSIGHVLARAGCRYHARRQGARPPPPTSM